MSTGIDAEDFSFIADLVRSESAIVVEPAKRYLVEARLAPVARRHGLDDVAALVARLRQRPGEGQGPLRAEVVESITNNETSFFRDAKPFAALEQHVLPELIASRVARRQISIWSGACSSGQEPYSIAMLIRSRFPQLSGWNVRILASDLSAAMLARAALGRYSNLEVSRGLPIEQLERSFTRAASGWQVHHEVRAMVELRALNLVRPWGPLPALDVVFLRNVLMYFDQETRRRILARVAEVLQPDGYLFLGNAETTLNTSDDFERVQVGPAVAYRLKPPHKEPAP